MLSQLPKNPQHCFMLTYAAIHFLGKGSMLPGLDKLVALKNGSNSERILKLKYMKHCMEGRVNLDNKDFQVLNTLMLWVEELHKINPKDTVTLVTTALLPHPNQLKF